MMTVNSVAALRPCIQEWRKNGLSIAFVPTMGNLHPGHLKLVDSARLQADRVVVSIFVNPTQFGPNEDFSSYPRTERQDGDLLRASDTDVLFLPAVDDIYPQPQLTHISVSGLSTLYCGASRPGHFDGVALIVCKLLNMVQPDWIFLGEKDFQQQLLIRQMVRDLNIPVQVQTVATIRESDGLAMSSRNGYLSVEERAAAPLIYQSLCRVRDAMLAGKIDFQSLIDQQSQILQTAGFLIDYFHLCRQHDLMPASNDDQDLVVLLAAKLGKTRLIDNICFVIPSALQISALSPGQ